VLLDVNDREEFRVGPFSLGDLIALGGVIFMSGALWWRVAALEREDVRQSIETERMVLRIQSLEQVIPSNYVRREDYREDIRELKQIVQRIELKVDGKQDRGRMGGQ
jgi:hypothetical protein